MKKEEFENYEKFKELVEFLIGEKHSTDIMKDLVLTFGEDDAIARMEALEAFNVMYDQQKVHNDLISGYSISKEVVACIYLIQEVGSIKRRLNVIEAPLPTNSDEEQECNLHLDVEQLNMELVACNMKIDYMKNELDSLKMEISLLNK